MAYHGTAAWSAGQPLVAGGCELVSGVASAMT
jgi:hypothetical protein